LKGMPLTTLQLPDTVKNIEWLKDVKTLRVIRAMYPAEFWKNYDVGKKQKESEDKK